MFNKISIVIVNDNELIEDVSFSPNHVIFISTREKSMRLELKEAQATVDHSSIKEKLVCVGKVKSVVGINMKGVVGTDMLRGVNNFVGYKIT